MARNDQRAIPLWLLVLAAVLLVARVVSYATKEKVADQVHWLSIEEGIERARATDKRILYDFTADWCVPCHQLDAAVFQDVQLARAINESFVPVRVVDRKQEEGRNTPEVAALQKRYAVNGFPTLVFADADGTERARMEGFSGVKQFERVMEQAR
jgi:thiol:disulfide interchange protein DsbD